MPEPTTDRRLTAAVASLLGLALALRVAAVFLASDFPPCCDAQDYIRHGQSIAAGHGYPQSGLVADSGPTLLRVPAYPYFLGAVYKVSHDSNRAARLAQAVVGTVTVGLLGLLAWQVFGRRRIALVAMALAAAYPPLVLSATALLSEAIFIPLELAVLVAAWQFRRDGGSLRFVVVAGVMAGLAALTRQTGVLIVLPAAAAILTAPGLLRSRRWVATIVMVLAIGVTITPWAIRNAVVAHVFSPLGVQTGLQLAGVYNDVSRNDPNGPALWYPPSVIPRDAPLFTRHGISEVDLDRLLTQNALEYARAHPTYVVQATVLNSLRMLHIGNDVSEHLGALSDNLDPGYAQLSRFGFYIAALLAIAGIFTRAWRRVPLWFWITPWVFFVAGAATAGLIRYRLPVDPFILLAAAPFLVWLWDRRAAPTTTTLPTAAPASHTTPGH